MLTAKYAYQLTNKPLLLRIPESVPEVPKPHRKKYGWRLIYNEQLDPNE